MIVTLEEKVSNLSSLRDHHCICLKYEMELQQCFQQNFALWSEWGLLSKVKVIVHTITKSRFLRNVLHCILFVSVILSCKAFWGKMDDNWIDWGGGGVVKKKKIYEVNPLRMKLRKERQVFKYFKLRINH